MFRIFVLMVMFLMVPMLLSAQDGTDRWRLIWDPNTEADMLGYIKFRDTNASPTAVIGDTTMHNDPANRIWDDEQGKEVMQFIDSNLVAGVQYWYRLKAVDSSGLESDYSATVSAAIPEFNQVPEQIVRTGLPFPAINLDVFAYDPDADPGELIFTIVSSGVLTSVIDANNEMTTSYPAGWVGSDQVVVKVEDADEFNSYVTITFTATAPVTEPSGLDFRFLN